MLRLKRRGKQVEDLELQLNSEKHGDCTQKMFKDCGVSEVEVLL